MFLILIENEIFGFWGNKIGDEFIENTIKNLKLDKDKVKLLHFFELDEKPEHCIYEQGKLVIQKQVQIETPSEIEGEPASITIALQTVKSLEGVVFYDKGIFVKPC